MNNRAIVLHSNNVSSGQNQVHNFRNKYIPDQNLAKPSREVANATTAYTQKILDQLITGKTEVSHTVGGNHIKNSESTFIKYTPTDQITGKTGQTRLINVQEIQDDPLAVAKFRHKRIPRGPSTPPKVILRSPPRKLTAKDQQDWKIPPCMSNWVNVKGYTIPLDMRVAADGRILQQHTINEKFSQLSDAYFVAESQARKEIEERNKIQTSIAYKEFKKNEEEMKKAALLAREEKNKLLESMNLDERVKEGKLSKEEAEAQKERDNLRYIRKREIEREKRLEEAKSKKSKIARDAERDVTEKIVLNQAQATNQEGLFDERLFNQTAGVDGGYGSEDEYRVYDKPLFNDRTAASIYKNVRNVPEDDDIQEVEDILQKGPMNLSNDQNASRTKPVEFEKMNDDMFGMDTFVNDPVKKKRKLD